ncbi:MAG: outer membrane beta-barrel protein [Gammaproteobacteria bacterium]|nr:outer membrane beta-barrel protein [Gammaproteobacteria bacterium]
MKKIYPYAILAITTTSPAFSAITLPIDLSHGVIALSGAPAWSDAGLNQTITSDPEIDTAYIAQHQTRLLGTAELFLGLQQKINPRLSAQYGLALAGSGTAKLSGDVWQDADPNFDNFTYTYNESQFRVALKGKLMANDWVAHQPVEPYVSGSVGVGFNRAFGYSAWPKIFEAVPPPGFTDSTTTAFTYTVGAGIQKTLGTHWQAGLGYEFADWGASHLGAAPDQTLNGGLSLNHLYVNALQFTLGYVG